MVTTRDEPGTLDAGLERLGATVVHVPLIEIVEPADGGSALADALSVIDRYDWVVVTSRHGARRVAAAMRDHPDVKLAAVGGATAVELQRSTGRDVDLVPSVQRASALLSAMPSGPGRVLVAQADLADGSLTDGLIAAGFQVDSVVAYRTTRRRPTPGEVTAALAADAVGFASGSAASAWADTIGTRTPPVVCVIGPVSAEVATNAGLKVTAIAADHSVEGLIDVIVASLTA